MMVVQSIAELRGMVFVTVCDGDPQTTTATETFRVSPGRLKRLSVPLSEGIDVDEALYTELTRAAAVTEAVRIAAGLLAASDKSVRRLKDRLREKGVDEEAAEEAAAFMVRRGYLDERRQAAAYAETAVRTRLYGKRRVSRELRARGYDSAVVRRATDEIPEEDYDAALKKYLAKTLAKSYNVDKDQMRRVVAAAERMGHSPAAALRYIRDFQQSDEDESVF